jgi:hypothetical protein
MGTPRHRRDGVRGARDRARGARGDGSGRAGHGRVSRVALALTLAAFCAGCDGARKAQHASVVPPPAQEENFAALDSPSLQFLPRGEEAPGWRLDKDPIVVPANRLPGYLGGETISFNRYEAMDMTAGQYVSVAGNGFANVEIFRFPDFVKAFGAYSIHKQGPMVFTALANEAFISKHSVHLWRGPFYVRVVGGGTPDGNQSLLRLASAVADRMPPAPSKPAVFNFFPVTNRIPNSERYAADSGFGQRFLGNSFQASFDVEGAKIEGLAIPAANKNAATQILEAYRQLYVHNGKLLDPIPQLGEDNFTAEDRYLGRVVAFRLDRFVIAFNGFNERQKLVDLAAATDQRILATIRKQLVSADEAAKREPSPEEAAPSWTQRQ